VPNGAHNADSDAPVFFVSYAHFPENHGQAGPHGRYIMEFFDAVSDNVSQLLGLRTGDYPGFLDRTALTGGQRWTRELFLAGSTCEVFVPLVSPGLVNSEWCGMEWDMVARRTVVRRQGGEPVSATGMLPVVWIRTEFDELPPAVGAVQFFTPAGLPPGHLAMYQNEGLFGMRQLGENAAYNAVVWRLAQDIVKVRRTYRVLPLDPVPENTGCLDNAFAKEEG